MFWRYAGVPSRSRYLKSNVELALFSHSWAGHDDIVFNFVAT